MKKSVIAVDLFCGVGGLTRGLMNAGVIVKKGFDIEKNVSYTYEKNNLGASFFSINVSDLRGKKMMEGIDRENSYFLLAGCAPCQPFSSINRKISKGDERRDLLLQFGRLIKETKPDFIMMENVPGLINKGQAILEKFLEILKELKYNYEFRVLDTKDYGVPQKRKRFVLVASAISDAKIPVPDENSKKVKTVRETIGAYPRIKAGEKDNNIPNHEARDLSEINKKRLSFIKKNGGSRTDLPEDLALNCHKRHNGHGDVYGRMAWDDASPTLTCKCTSISNGRFGHPSQNRGISVREAAAIQTFQDDYIFYGNMGENTRWIGNAVPVKFAEAFGEYFISLTD